MNGGTSSKVKHNSLIQDLNLGRQVHFLKRQPSFNVPPNDLWLNDFNGLLICLELFYAWRLDNRVQCTLIFILLMLLFINPFFIFCTWSYGRQIILKQIYLTDKGTLTGMNTPRVMATKGKTTLLIFQEFKPDHEMQFSPTHEKSLLGARDYYSSAQNTNSEFHWQSKSYLKLARCLC